MEDSYIHQNRIRQIFFLVILSLLGYLLGKQFVAFLPAFLGALTLYVLLRKTMYKLTDKKGWPKVAAASLLMFGSFVIILVPIVTLITMLSEKVSYAVTHSNELVAAVNSLLQNIESRFGINLVSTEYINKLSEAAGKMLPGVVGATFNTLGTIFFMYFILYFMLVNEKEMEVWLYEHIPLQEENVKKLGKELETMTYSNGLGIPLIALMQGIVALIGFYILGVDEPLFWFVVTCISAMLPVIGAALGFVPPALIFLANGQTWQGIALLIFGFGIIGLVDNVARFSLAKKIGNVHPLITVFGVIIGIKLFGFIGLIFGPIIISLFLSLIRVYTNEFIQKQRDMAPNKKIK